jgi:hypothetical protein
MLQHILKSLLAPPVDSSDPELKVMLLYSYRSSWDIQALVVKNTALVTPSALLPL